MTEKTTREILIPLDLSSNELGVQFTNVTAIQKIYDNCILPLINKKIITSSKIPSVVVILSTLDHAINELNDMHKFTTTGKYQFTQIEINALEKINEMLKTQNAQQAIILNTCGERMAPSTASTINDRIKENSETIINNEAKIAKLKVSFGYKTWRYSPDTGEFKSGRSYYFVQTMMSLLKTIGLSTSELENITESAEELSASLFSTSGMLDE